MANNERTKRPPSAVARQMLDCVTTNVARIEEVIGLVEIPGFADLDAAHQRDVKLAIEDMKRRLDRIPELLQRQIELRDAKTHVE